MKGISAMIAVVLLIAFTVAVGGLISVWFTTFTRTTTSGVEAATTNQTRCAGAYIKVDSVTSSSIVFSNPTSQTISSINMVTSDGTIIGGLGVLGAGSINSTSWVRGTNTSVILKGLCLASVPVEGSCKVGDSCWI